MKWLFTTITALIIGSCYASFSPSAEASAPTAISLPVVIRDFSMLAPQKHPDFETFNTGFVTGIVNTTLGANGKPVFSGNTLAVSSAASFGQWYTDNSFNQAINSTLELTMQNGIYTYSNASFFPIDNQLWGNEGLPHNYHFTVESHSKFIYEPGQTVSFTMDDDYWVFIDNKLVVDGGGVHGPISATVDLDTKALIPGQAYDFALFQAERHTTGSNFTIRTDIVFDTAPPDTAIVSGPAVLASTPSATFSFNGNEDNVAFQCQLDNGAYSACANSETFSGLADGSHTLLVKAIDPVGNVDPTPASYTWTVDTTAPDTIINTNPAAITKDASASFSFSSNESGVTYESSLDGAAFAASTSLITLNGLADGSHTLAIRAIDPAGNVDAVPTSYTWMIDRVKPVITRNGDARIEIVQGAAFTDPGASASDNVDGNLSTAITVSGDAVDTQTIGEYTMAYTVSDAAGNAADTVERVVKVIAAPATSPVTSGSSTALSANADLFSLELAAEGEHLAITPAFRPDITSYVTQTTANEALVTAKTSDASAKAALTMNGQDINGGKLALKEGDNRLVIVVKAESGVTKMYTVTIRLMASFSDLAGHWAEEQILKAVEQKLVTGYPDGTFKPNHSITRAEFTVMLMNAIQPNLSQGASLTFKDKAEIGEWAQGAIAAAVHAGIIQGYTDGYFHPNATITRAEMAVMIARALNFTTDANIAGFADFTAIPQWAQEAVNALQANGLIQGRSGNRFAPNEQATRAEAAVLLLRILN
ncbi:S-layer homology domain-containing protein [Paenibacillus sp. MMS18-CY102]|uniref:S-layer homology domain-containing protein n=1 Tax=Paenibacillus sp. MMS18-CY102 TaxID=2682849 RepID=UPI0013AC32D3|nr:S-layer homology domain-containing protein [Paenibacillus sp. MMS18-CY102]MWC28832.1 fibro-slime domain-containing protein [Paenibacillus sp. MMS18-CY102]